VAHFLFKPFVTVSCTSLIVHSLLSAKGPGCENGLNKHDQENDSHELHDRFLPCVATHLVRIAAIQAIEFRQVTQSSKACI
jgi:hypothetical protein